MSIRCSVDPRMAWCWPTRARLNSIQESFRWFTEVPAGLEAGAMSRCLEFNMFLTGMRISAVSGLVRTRQESF